MDFLEALVLARRASVHQFCRSGDLSALGGRATARPRDVAHIDAAADWGRAPDVPIRRSDDAWRRARSDSYEARLLSARGRSAGPSVADVPPVSSSLTHASIADSRNGGSGQGGRAGSVRHGPAPRPSRSSCRGARRSSSAVSSLPMACVVWPAVIGPRKPNAAGLRIRPWWQVLGLMDIERERVRRRMQADIHAIGIS